MTVEDQAEIQRGLGVIESKLESQKQAIKEIYALAIGQGLEDKTGIIKIANDSYSTLIDNMVELCIEYGKLLEEIENM